ncbi:Rdx family protein [Planctomycetes bacterium Pan216]|uniref:Rdx family protein n=1 Tax=Kolteria novifilia TaxID=2527975 RepID=A0A518B285_9BACT|nr:Rdx family protein [Planctomycetes bacterium Pan216]
MNVRIKYCQPCGYRRYAEELAGHYPDAELSFVPGFFGVFKVWIDDRLVFDRYQTGGVLGRVGLNRLPTPAEIHDHIRRELEVAG